VSNKWSPLWDYFQVGKDSKFSICASCEAPISQGGKTFKNLKKKIKPVLSNSCYCFHKCPIHKAAGT